MHAFRFAIFAPLALILSWALPQLQAGDEVTLTSGKVIVGEVISAEDAETVRIRVQEGSIKAVLHYPAAQVSKIALGVNDHLAEVEAQRKHIATFTQVPMPNLQAWWQAIVVLQEMDEDAEFKVAAQDLLEFFPDFQRARAALGQQRYEGEWMSEAEIKMAQGLNYYDGAWRSEEEIETIMEQKALAREERQRERDLRQARREMRQEAARIQAANNAAYYYPAHPLDRPYSALYYYHRAYFRPRPSPHFGANHSYYPRSSHYSGYSTSSGFQLNVNFSFP